MRVLVVDDHQAIRCGVKILLGMAEDIEVVGEAGEAEEAVHLAAELEPDLVIVDLRLKGDTGGVEVCRKLKSFPEPSRVLIHTSYNTAGDSMLAALADADGYLCKSVECVGLPEAVRRTFAGERLWLLSDEPDETQAHLEGIIENANLTLREQEIFILLLRRYSNARIAEKLCVSLPTVKSHVKHILRKLGAKNRDDLLQSLAS